MKNIHVLPTDKPSKLRVHECGQLFLSINFIYEINDENKKHIYITSDEKFARDEYVTDGIEVMKATSKLVDAQGLVDRRDWKKIILTTDQELIKDGVQAIDDEFLEWFVKNPSCEEVEFLYEPKNFLDIKQGWEYLIISKIIKEEPNKTHYLDEAPNIDKDALLKMWNAAMPKLEPKQETLEEVAKRYATDMSGTHYEDLYNAFINGTKWQQEQDKNKYSAEEQTDILEVGQILVNEETLEYGLLQYIKICLECNNESQAIRLLEKYGFEKQEERYSKEDMEEMYSYGYNNFLPLEEAFKQFKKK